MAAPADVTNYDDVLVMLAAASVAVPLLQRVRLNPILAYLLIGMVLGPHMLGGLFPYDPVLRWFTGVRVRAARTLRRVGRHVSAVHHRAGTGTAPPLDDAAPRLRAGFGASPDERRRNRHVRLVHGADDSRRDGHRLFPGAVVHSHRGRTSPSQNRMSLGTGRASFAILLLQDLAVIPLLLLVPMLGTQGGQTLVSGLSSPSCKASPPSRSSLPSASTFCARCFGSSPPTATAISSSPRCCWSLSEAAW